MASFKDIMDMIANRKVPEPSKRFWMRFDGELREKLDAIDSRRMSSIFSVFLQPKPVLAAATFVLAMNLILFSLASRGPVLVSVALLSKEDLAGELVLTNQLTSGENVVDF